MSMNGRPGRVGGSYKNDRHGRARGRENPAHNTKAEYHLKNFVITVERGPVGRIARIDRADRTDYAGPIPPETEDAIAEVADD